MCPLAKIGAYGPNGPEKKRNNGNTIYQWTGSTFIDTTQYATYIDYLFLFFQTLSQDTSKISNEIEGKLDELSKLENSDGVNIDDIDKEPLPRRDIDEETEKRNIGRWKNYRWNVQNYKQDRDDYKQDRNKRFIGRWKNLNWLNYRHGIPDSQPVYDDLDKRADGYMDNFGYENALVPYLYGDDILEKRQGGRWALINRQLNRLTHGRTKKDDEFEEYPDDGNDVDKRMGSRWRLIQSKLHDLSGRSKRSLYDKRFIGRWKNHNWMLGHGKVDYDSALPWNDKRNIGRWKNQNWILEQYRDRKSKSLN